MGTGKTSLLVKKAREYVDKTGNYVYILDPQGTFPVPEGYKSKFRFVKLDAHNMRAVFEYICTLKDAMIILDDARIYTDYANTYLLDLCINHRHRNIDVFIVYHTLYDVNKKLWQFAAHCYVFRVQDTWAEVKRRTSLAMDEQLFNQIKTLEKYHFLYFLFGNLQKSS
ncbi:MAG: hypothetical protein QXR53_05055 [Candidatus Norongarragalinales archaeon]